MTIDSSISSLPPFLTHTIVPSKPRFFKTLPKLFDSFVTRCSQSSLAIFYRKRITPITPLLSEVGNILTQAANAKAFSFLLRFFFSSASAAEKETKNSSWIGQAVKSAKLLTVVTVPIALVYTIQNFIDIFHGTEKIDALLQMGENLSWVGDSFAIFIASLENIEVLKEVGKVSFSLSIASSLLATATIALSGRRLYHNQCLLKEMGGKGSSEEILKWLVLKDKYFFFKHFDSEGEKIKSSLLKIIESAKDRIGEGREELVDESFQQVVSGLRRRIQTKNWSHCLSILSAVVTLIGTSILLFTPLAVPAFVILAIASLVSIGKFFYEKNSNFHLSETFKEASTKLSG